MNQTTVYITGMGVINAIGHNCKQFAESLRNGTSAFIKDDSGSYIAQIDHFNTDDYKYISENLASSRKRFQKYNKRLSRNNKLAVHAVFQALVDAGLSDTDMRNKKVAIVAAGSNLSSELQYKMALKYCNDLDFVTPSYALGFFDTDIMAILTDIFQSHGEGYSIGGASASGNYGIIHGARIVTHNEADICVVVGPSAALSPLEKSALLNLGAMCRENEALSPQEVCRPFDSQHSGFVLGEGSGCIILESKNSADSRAVCGRAVYLGSGVYLDGNRYSNASTAGEVQAMSAALVDAGLQSSEIDYVNAHATSTPLGDIAEAEAINEIFKDYCSTVKVNATKGLTGHCFMAAGIIEAIASVIQMEQCFLHPNLNLKNSISLELDLVGETFLEQEVTNAMSNSFGFGGINTSIILKKYSE